VKQSVHPAVVAVAILVVVGVVFLAYQRLTGPPRYSESERKEAAKLLGIQPMMPNQARPAGPGGLLAPQARPPGGNTR
jgi:hypothetical protein